MTGLAWIYDWNEVRVDEEVVLACQYGGADTWVMVLARLHRFDERGHRPANARWGNARDARWSAWQSTWDGRQLPADFRPLAFARLNTPEEGPIG